MFDCCEVSDVIVKREINFFYRDAPDLTVLSVSHVTSIWLDLPLSGHICLLCV